MNILITFTPAAPTAGTFAKLRAIITDSVGVTHTSDLSASQVTDTLIANGDGSYSVPMVVDGVAFGPYTGRAMALTSTGDLMGSELEFSGDATIEEGGTWYPQPTAAA